MEGLKGESDKAKEKSSKVEGEVLRKIPECSAEIRHQTLTAVWHFKVPEHFTPHAGGQASMWAMRPAGKKCDLRFARNRG